MTDGLPRSDGRRRTLAGVLRLLHEGRASTRAELTRETGLNRSTVAATVAELEALGLVVEGDPPAPDPIGIRRVGRPSPAVAPHGGPVVVAVNPELDAVTVAAVGLGARVGRRIRREVDHPVTPDEVVRIVARTVPDLGLGGRRLVGIGVAVPGLVRADDGLVRWAPHLGWTDAELGPALERELGTPAAVGNDASLGALAEQLFGAGRGVADLVYVNGGASGVGGGVIVDGHALGGTSGYAGEFGHTRTGLAGPGDRRTADGILEDEVSRALLLDAVGLDTADEPELDAAVIAALSTGAAPAVTAEVGRQRRILADALGAAVNVLNPELVVLGGFLATLLRADPEGLEALVARSSVGPAAPVRIRPAGLGRDRLLIGAAELAFTPLIADPVA